MPSKINGHRFLTTYIHSLYKKLWKKLSKVVDNVKLTILSPLQPAPRIKNVLLASRIQQKRDKHGRIYLIGNANVLDTCDCHVDIFHLCTICASRYSFILHTPPKVGATMFNKNIFCEVAYKVGYLNLISCWMIKYLVCEWLTKLTQYFF